MQSAPFVFLHEDDVGNKNFTMENSTNDHLLHGGILSGDSPFASDLSRFLITAVLAIVLSRIFHVLLRKLGQPRVVAEILAGLCFSPSIMGQIPGLQKTFLQETSVTILNLSANVAIILYVFLVGLEIESQMFRQCWHRSRWISLAGVVCPVLVDVACAYGLYTYVVKETEPHIPTKSFILFVGVAMSITALPVLARILIQRKLIATPVGTVAISVAAIDAAVCWSLLSFIIAILRAADNLVSIYVCLLIVAYSFIITTPIRSLISRLFDKFLVIDAVEISQFWTSVILICLFLSSWITEIMGVHCIFGAFLIGLIVPRRNNFAIRLAEKIEDLVLIVLLPMFFVATGLKTNLGLFNDGTVWLWIFIVVSTSIFGKLTSCLIAARFTGMTWRESFSIGMLMNTKGLISLIAFNIGHEIRIINDRIFLIMVIMALTTTFMTPLILSAIYGPKYHKSLATKRKPFGRLSVAHKRMSIFHRISLTLNDTAQVGSLQTDHGRECVQKIRMLVVLDDDYAALIIMVRFILLFRGGQFADFNDCLSITALKIVEPTERMSSLMMSKKIEEVVKSDVSLNMMRMFAAIGNVPVNSLATVSPASEIGDEVDQIAESESCNLILVPYDGQISHSSLSNRHKVRDVIHGVRKAVICVVAPKSSFVPEANTAASCNILVVIGEANEDELILRLVTQFLKCEATSVSVTILKFAEHGVDTETVPEKLIQQLSMERPGNVTLKISHSMKIETVIINENMKKEYDYIMLPRKLSRYADSSQQSASSLRSSMSSLSHAKPHTVQTSKKFLQSFVRGRVHGTHDLNKSQSDPALDGTPASLSPTRDDRRFQHADDTDSLASTRSKKKRARLDILGHVGQALYESSDVNAVLLVINQTSSH